MSRKRTKSDSGFLQEGESSTMDDSFSGFQVDPKGPSVPSYASMVRNRQVNAMGDMDGELTEVDCCFSSGKEGVGLSFSAHAHEVLSRSWKSAVVVRLMGKPNSVSSFDFMLRGLRRKWRSNGGWKLVDLLNDWFIVKFELEEDMEDVMCGGPWIISGQTLVVKRWSAGFDPISDEIGSMAVWARIIGLPVMYFSEFAMGKIGKLLGDVVRVDKVTLEQERGRFARVCVEMDLSKPFCSSVMVDNVNYKVQYEGLSLLCFSCGVFGHTKEQCNAGSDGGLTAIDAQVNAKSSSGQECCDGAGSEDVDMGMGQVPSSEPKKTFGPWMLVNYRNKKKPVKGNVEGVQPVGSRFAVLQGEGDEEVQGGAAEVGEASEASGFAKKSSGEASKVWTFLQNKIKERNGVGSMLEMENGNGAYIWPKGKEDVAGGLVKHSVAPRIPLIDLSNSGKAKGKGNAKFPKKNSDGQVSVQVSRKPFANSVEFKSSKFAGFFGKCPPEEGVSLNECGDDEVSAGRADILGSKGDSEGCGDESGVGMSLDK